MADLEAVECLAHRDARCPSLPQAAEEVTQSGLGGHLFFGVNHVRYGPLHPGTALVGFEEELEQLLDAVVHLAHPAERADNAGGVIAVSPDLVGQRADRAAAEAD